MCDFQSICDDIIDAPMGFGNRHLYEKMLSTRHYQEMEKIADRLKRLWERNELSQTEAAKMLGMAQPSLSAIESGKTKTITGRTLALACKNFHTTAEHVFFGDPDIDDKTLAADLAEITHMYRALDAAARKSALDSIRGIFNGQQARAQPSSSNEGRRVFDAFGNDPGAPPNVVLRKTNVKKRKRK